MPLESCHSREAEWELSVTLVQERGAGAVSAALSPPLSLAFIIFFPPPSGRIAHVWR